MNGFPPEIREGIMLRDLNTCMMVGAPGCKSGPATEANHRLNRGMGGTSLAVVNSTANGCALEHGCNWRLEQSAEFAEEGRRRGVKLEPGEDAETVITTTPIWSPPFRQWLILNRAGAHLTGVTDPTLDAREAGSWLTL